MSDIPVVGGPPGAPTPTPLEPISVAIVPLKPPFSDINFYEEKKTISALEGTPRKLWFETDSEDTGWTTVDQGQLASYPVTGTNVQNKAPGITTAYFQWPGDLKTLAYWELVGAETVLPSATVAVNASPQLTATTNGAVTSSPSHTDGKRPYAGTVITSDTPAVPTTPTTSLPVASPSRSTTAAAISQSNGLSGGAIAGIAIGCLLAGALIAGLVAFFCLKRRKSATGVRDSEASTVALMAREKGPIAKTVSVSSGSPIAFAVENRLPQPLEDKAISGEISKISNSIKNHVQSYYHTRPVSPGMIDYDYLQTLGEDLPLSVGTLSTLLQNSTTREIALRFCLAWVVTSRIQFNSSSNGTFLPPEVSKSIQSMTHVDRGSRVQSLFFSKWRVLTAELLQSTYVRNPFSSADGRLRNIQSTAAILDSVLRPFADSRMDDGARSRNLEEILKRSAQFAFTLFSQPTAWDFDWHGEEGVKSGSLCIFPALVQVTDENGEPIKPARPFSEAVVRRLDE